MDSNYSNECLSQILDSEKKNVSNLTNTKKIRTTEEINQEVAELNKFYNSRHNIIKKYLIQQNTYLNLIIWAIFSLFFYFLAFIAYYLGPTTDPLSFFAFNSKGFVYYLMPIYLFACLFTVDALTSAIKRAVLAVPKIMSIPLDNYEKTIRRFESNLAPAIIALPFILINLVGIIGDLSKNTFFTLIPTVLLFVSWVVEWLLFGNILWLMFYYMVYIRRITNNYNYDSELLSVILKNEIKPIIHVGHEQGIILGIFLIINIIYIIFKGFFVSDLFASLLIFVLIPIITIVPINLVHKDLTKEINAFSEKSLDRILQTSKILFLNKDMTPDEKIDFMFTDRILYRLNQVHKSHKNYIVYLRVVIAMAVPLAGYYVDYGQTVISRINVTMGTNIHLIKLMHLKLIPLIHYIYL